MIPRVKINFTLFCLPDVFWSLSPPKSSSRICCSCRPDIRWCWEYAAFTPSKIGIKVQGPFNVSPSINLGLWLIPEAPSSQFWVVNFCRWIPSTSRAGSCINKPRSSINLRLEITKRSVFTILTMTDKLSSSQVAGQWTVGKYGFRRNKLFNF